MIVARFFRASLRKLCFSELGEEDAEAREKPAAAVQGEAAQPARPTGPPLHLLTAALLLTVGSRAGGLRHQPERRTGSTAGVRRAPGSHRAARRGPHRRSRAGTDGGLRFTMVFRLPPAAALLRPAPEAVRSGQWRPLPIPTAELRHLAAIRTVLAQKARTAQPGRLPAADRQGPEPHRRAALQASQASLPPLPRLGWFQIRTAVTDILWARQGDPQPRFGKT